MKNKWLHHLVKIDDNTLMSNGLLKKSILSFYSEIVPQDKHVLLVVKAIFDNGRV